MVEAMRAPDRLSSRACWAGRRLGTFGVIHGHAPADTRFEPGLRAAQTARLIAADKQDRTMTTSAATAEEHADPAVLAESDPLAQRRSSGSARTGAPGSRWPRPGAKIAAMALVAVWPNPLTVIVALFVIGARQLGCAVLMHDAPAGESLLQPSGRAGFTDRGLAACSHSVIWRPTALPPPAPRLTGT